MILKKSIKALIASLVLGCSAAYAGCIENPINVGISVGILGSLGDGNIGYVIDPGTVTGTASTTALTVAGGNAFSVNTDNNGLEGLFSLLLGYTNTEVGAGINLEFQFNTLDLEGTGAATVNTFEANAWGLFLNLDFHTLASAAHNADSNIGGYFSIGVGFLDYTDIDGTFAFTGTAPTGTTNAIENYTGIGTYNDFSEFVFAGKIKLGVEGLLGRSATFGVNLALIAAAEADNLTDGATDVVIHKADGSVAVQPVATDFALSIPTMYYGYIEARVSYFFGGNM
jgi:hypothetical protein